uniref:Uncharacterized protein n=1 Tax=Strigamia maritima TaxID=126957 RepID=T1J2S1_STRMM
MKDSSVVEEGRRHKETKIYYEIAINFTRGRKSKQVTTIKHFLTMGKRFTWMIENKQRIA